jgi:hypothetical protein
VREYRVERLFAVAVLKSFDVRALREFRSEMFGENHFAANGVIMLDDASENANDNDRRMPVGQ